MMSNFLITLSLVASIFPVASVAGPAQVLQDRSGSVCSIGIYGELVPELSGFPVAQDFCAVVYPVKCTKPVSKRAAPSTTKSATSKCSTTTTTTTIAKTSKGASAWAKCKTQPAHVVSTVCSCIQPPPKECLTTSKTTLPTIKPASTTTPTTTTTTTKPPTTEPPTTTTTTTPPPPSTTTTATTTVPPIHTVAAPRCDSAGLDNGGCNDACVCQSSVTGVEYCSSEFSYEDSSITCQSDDDCPQGDFCEILDTANRCATGTRPGNVCLSTYNPGTRRSLDRSLRVLARS